MDLGQIREDFVKKNGRYDLVVDTTDYADNGANFFIQAGQRYLDLALPHKMSKERFVKDLAINDQSVIIDGLRTVEECYINNGSDDRVDLSLRSYSWLLKQYGEDFGQMIDFNKLIHSSLLRPASKRLCG